MRNGLEIARRKLRGEWSNGMLCSPPELGLPGDPGGAHQPGDALAGVPAALAAQLRMHPRGTVAALGLLMDGLNLPGQPGVLPLALTPGEPVPDAHTEPSNPAPGYVRSYSRRK